MPPRTWLSNHIQAVISMTHQSASTVNETPVAAVQRILRRAFFPTEELYFEVHRICLKNKCKIKKRQKALCLWTWALSQDKVKHRLPYENALRCTLWRRAGGWGGDCEGGTHLQAFRLCNCMWVDFQSISTRLVNFSPGFSGFLLRQTFQPY